MEKPQAPTPLSKFVQSLITFPGYAGILFGWLIVFGFAVWALMNVFFDTKVTEIITPDVVEPAAASDSRVTAIVLAIFIAIALIAAVWVYVAQWTKRAVLCTAELCGIKKTAYWAFCTVLVMIAWVAASALLYAAHGDQYLGAFLFLSAGVIAVSSLSFGVAALKHLPIESQNNTKEFSVSFTDTKVSKSIGVSKKMTRRAQKKDIKLKHRTHPDSPSKRRS